MRTGGRRQRLSWHHNKDDDGKSKKMIITFMRHTLGYRMRALHTRGQPAEFFRSTAEYLISENLMNLSQSKKASQQREDLKRAANWRNAMRSRIFMHRSEHFFRRKYFHFILVVQSDIRKLNLCTYLNRYLFSLRPSAALCCFSAVSGANGFGQFSQRSVQQA